jgi:ABC-type Zn uptake system ZnuABC Zn-binding protein ZnuA
VIGMTRTPLLLAFVLGLLAHPSARGAAGVPAPEKLRVVTTIPDLADVARRIGGERVEVSSIARGKENTHAVPVRPSHLVAMSKADLFVQIGLSLEASYVPGLLEGCRNRRIQPGAPGFVNCSEGWEPIDVPASLSRRGGDVHPQGNPHMNLDPRGGRHIADCVLAGLVRVDPARRDEYGQRHGAYVAELDAAVARWAAMGAAWKGEKVVEYHQEFRYFARAYGIELVATIESKPGIPPTPNHLAEVIARMRSEGVKVIATATWSNEDTVERVADATGARVLELPNMCGGLPGTETWIGMMDVLHRRVAEAFGAGSPPR